MVIPAKLTFLQLIQSSAQNEVFVKHCYAADDMAASNVSGYDD